MDEPSVGQLLIDSADRLLAAISDDDAFIASRSGALPGHRWDEIEGFGLPLLLIEGDEAGLGVAPADAWAVVQRLGYHAAPYPIAETMLANRVLAAAGLPLAEGPAALVRAGPGWTVSNKRARGTADRVAWGRSATTLVIEGDGQVIRIGQTPSAGPGDSVAGLPRDTLHIDAAGDAASYEGLPFIALGALARALQMAGALERMLGLTVAHVSERVQFGRPIAKFQAVQQSLAIFAGETAAATAAAAHAAEASAGAADEALFAIAIARARIGEAASHATAIAHQLHGAIGYAREHILHRFTTALWAWRDEFGTQRYWTDQVGARALSVGRDGYWPMVTAA